MDGAGEVRVTSTKKWSVVYPVYINSRKTVAEGRRVAAGKACPDPTCAEIADCCSHLKIPCRIEVTHQAPALFSHQ
jgi:signal recognition particle subunit SRP19